MRKADNLTTILGHCHVICDLNFLEPSGHLGPVMGRIYLYSEFVYSKLDWSVYTCLTQLYGGRDMYNMYNLLHKEQLHVSALVIGHLQVDK